MKILIIEDDPFFQKYFSTKLQENGFEVVVSADGEDGLNKIKEIKPNLVLLDMILPKKDGFEILKTLNTDNIIQTLPIIVFSTLGQETDVQKAIKLGAKDFINKSFFDFDKILTKINSFLKK